MQQLQESITYKKNFDRFDLFQKTLKGRQNAKMFFLLQSFYMEINTKCDQ